MTKVWPATVLGCACFAALFGPPAAGGQSSTQSDAYLTWSTKRAELVGSSMYKTGRVGGFFDTRGLRTDRSYNYKLAATWLTPEVIRASSRLAQLRSRLPAEAARKLVAEAEAVKAQYLLGTCLGQAP